MDFLVREDDITNAMLLPMDPAPHIHPPIIEEVDPLPVLQVSLVVADIRAARLRPYVRPAALLNRALPLTRKNRVILLLNGHAIPFDLIFAVLTDITDPISKHEFTEAVHLPLLHLSGIDLTISAPMHAEVRPLVILPETLIRRAVMFHIAVRGTVHAVIGTAVITEAVGHTRRPLAVVDVAIGVDLTAEAFLFVFGPHAKVPTPLRLTLLTIPLLYHGPFLHLTRIDSPIDLRYMLRNYF